MGGRRPPLWRRLKAATIMVDPAAKNISKSGANVYILYAIVIVRVSG